MTTIRTLIVDDSSLVRRLLVSLLDRFSDIEVVGTAQDAYAARDLLVTLRPDVVLLDIHMPRMDGVSFLRRYMRVCPTATVVLSTSVTTNEQLVLEAIDAGAVDVIDKPSIDVLRNSDATSEALVNRIRDAARANPILRNSSSAEGRTIRERLLASAPPAANPVVVAIGASTGGVAALAQILSNLPAAFPGTVIVQHMPQGTTRSLAASLDDTSPLQVRQAQQGDLVRPGTALIAPANDLHMVVEASRHQLFIAFDDTGPKHHQRPAVDVLFESVSQATSFHRVGVILTGMGRDGAQGLLAIRNAGGRTLAQDSGSSVVNGMPEAAWQLGAAEMRCSLGEIPERLVALATGISAATPPPREANIIVNTPLTRKG